MRPPMPYFGGKQSIAAQIVAMLPLHEHYVEPFCGGLSVLLAKRPSKIETVNDLDGDLMTFWRVLRDRPDELIRACALTPHSRAEHGAAYDRPDDLDDVERARRVWVLLSQGRANTLRRTGWRFYLNPAGTGISVSEYLSGYVDRMAEVAERMHHVSLEARPALDVIADYGRSAGSLLYVDPPYSGDTGRTLGYRVEMPGEDEHRTLASALRSCTSTVVLSGYHSDLYDELYGGWVSYEISAATHNGSGDSARTEVLWANRPLVVHQTFDFGGAA